MEHETVKRIKIANGVSKVTKSEHQSGVHRHDEKSCLPCVDCMTFSVAYMCKSTERWRAKIESNAAGKVHALGK